ncbi:MAG: LAGLIDADG family homing endonuclease [Candidatus Paceibacterota bacterium]
MGKNVSGADNQQGSPLVDKVNHDPSETTRSAPFRRKELIAYINGASHDASLNKGKRFRFAQKYIEWLRLLRDFLDVLGYKSWIYKEGKNRNVFILETLADFIDFDFNPSDLSEEEKIMYIKGFFDAEGSVPIKKGRFYIQLSQKDYEKILLIKNLLNDLGIKSGKIHNPSRKVDPNYWRIYVLAKSHNKFAKLIGSFHPVKNNIFRNRMVI